MSVYQFIRFEMLLLSHQSERVFFEDEKRQTPTTDVTFCVKGNEKMIGIDLNVESTFLLKKHSRRARPRLGLF